MTDDTGSTTGAAPEPAITATAPAPVAEAVAETPTEAPAEFVSTHRITLVGHNLPHADPMVVEASFSDLFFNHSHDELDRAKAGPYGDDDDFLKQSLRKDAEEFINTLATATGFHLDPDELVADFIARL